MKKVLVLLSLILIVFIISCAQPSQESLSELQVDACNTADDAGTCETRLTELGIVLPEECCEVLGKCC